jgi:anti-anti-sigma factor
MEQHVRDGRPTVDVETASPEIAIATLRGKHDLNSQAELADELARASKYPYLLVDLGECAFLDSTVMGLLVMMSQRMWERDCRLELVIPREATVLRRVLTVAGLTTFLTIHETRDDALAAVQAHD